MRQKIRYSSFLIAAFSFVLLSGCASLSKDECITGDWQGIGYRDGLQGKPEAFIAEHQTACSEYSITVDLISYQQGREIGLNTYCKADNGYRLGRSGAEYGYVCPRQVEKAFLQAYQAGREIYLQEKKVSDIEQQISRQLREVTQLKDKMDSTEKKLVSDGLSRAERQNLLQELRQLETELPSKQHMIERLKFDLYQAKSTLK